MTDAPGLSRILTLVFTDLVDSTALKRRLGDRAVGELISRHRALVGRLAGECSGRIIDWAGDGCFLTFETPSAAVSFALRLQQAHREEPDLPDVRTGLHMGEVSERPGPDGDAARPRVEGLAVDLAARIAGLARPGQALMSSAVADSARQRLDDSAFSQTVLWRAYGPYSLKGFDEPLEIREAGLEGVAPFKAPAASEKAKPTQPVGFATMRSHRTRHKLNIVVIGVLLLALAYLLRERFDLGQAHSPDAVMPASLAVLPFANRSAEEDTQYFVDGVHDDLLTQLARMSDLKVISRTSVREYRDTTKNIRQIAQELGVTTVLEGAVQRSGNRVRITAQLIDANTDEHLWADSFDRELSPTKIFEIQTEIARAISAALLPALAPEASGYMLDRVPTLNQEAYDLYQRARAIPYDGDVENLWRAIALAKSAVDLDPEFALAMGQIADDYINIYWFTTQQPEHRDAARDWIERALAIAPENPRLQLILSTILYEGYFDYDAALAAADRARQGMPGNSSVYLNQGVILRRSGHIDEAIEAFEKAQLLDPRDVFNIAHHVFTYLAIGDVAAARRQGDRVLAFPHATTVHVGFTKLVDLYLLGDTVSMADFLRDRPEADLGSEDHLKIMVPLLERRYDDVMAVLTTSPDPIVEQFNLWTHSFVRARVLHAQGRLDAAREQAALAVTELDRISATSAGNARPVVARALMHAILGNEQEARADVNRATELYPIELDAIDAPNYIADGLRALAVIADTQELSQELESYLSLPTKLYYIDFLLLDPVFDRHRDHPAIKALQARYTLRGDAR